TGPCTASCASRSCPGRCPGLFVPRLSRKPYQSDGLMILNALLTKVFGTTHEHELKRLQPMVAAINELGPSMEALDDSGLVAKSGEFRARLAAGATLNDLLTEALPVCREAADRRLGMLNVFNPAFGFDPYATAAASRGAVQRAAQRLAGGEPSPQILLPTSFNAEVRALNPDSGFPFRYRPFDVQFIGVIVLHEGKIAEMKTGEG